ncbi:MAG: type II toxin-antitoxin system Phd/YefM family antitoxin [Candidatus Binatia bacterium]
MSQTVTLEEAQAHLPELIDKLTPGQEVVIIRNEQPIARLVGEPPRVRKPRKPGSAKGKLIMLVEDEEHLEDFKEYML